MTATYGRTPGGYVWALAEPILGITLLTFIFSIGFRSPQLGVNFPIFYATGLLPFLLFNDLNNKVSQSINYSKQLLAYPRVTFLDAIIGRFILNFITQVLVSIIVIATIFLTFDTRTVFKFESLIVATVMLATLSISMGTFNCFLMSYLPVWQRVYSILSRPLLLVSGVIFTYESVPEPYRGWLWYNPLMHIIGIMRSGFYHNYDAQYASPLYVFSIAGGFGLFGFLLLRRFHRDILEI